MIADFSSTKLSIGGSANASTNVANEIENTVLAAISSGIALILLLIHHMTTMNSKYLLW